MPAARPTPVPGMPMVLMSGWIAADALDRDAIAPRRPAALTNREPAVNHAHPRPRRAPPSRAMPRAVLPHRWFWLLRTFGATQRATSASISTRFGYRPPARPFRWKGDDPILIVLNHPSWWDPMIGIILSSLMGDRDHFAAIDSQAVERYSFFKRLGFVGVDTRSLRGAAEFLRMGTTILSEPNRVFWVTAQGHFSDVRQRPLALQSGVGHLAARLKRGIVLPVALEYAFWTERTPEALVRIGQPLPINNHVGLSGKEWLVRIEEALTRNLDVLNAETMTRDPAKFIDLQVGRAGVGGVYDSWRRFKSLCARRAVRCRA